MTSSAALLAPEKSRQLENSPAGRELLEIIESERLTIHFQPIVDLKEKKVFAFESLCRGPENSKLFSPLNLFYAAEKNNCLLEMDLLARKLSIENFANMASIHNHSAKLFINVSARSLMSEQHVSGQTLDELAKNQLKLKQVVIEITELHPIDEFGPFLNAINHYRSMGFEVAIDDLGSGYNGLKLWSAVKPDYVKIDKHFVSSIDVHADKYQFMETIHALAKGLGTKVIAEGVETENELKVLEKIGVDYAQGFLLKRPSPIPSLQLNYTWKNLKQHSQPKGETIEVLTHPHPTFSPDRKVKEVSEFLLNRPELSFIPVIEQNKPVGIIWRNELMNILAGQYGRELHLKKKIHIFMDPKPLVYEENTALVEVSRDITNNASFNRSAFIVTRNGEYQGCGTFMNLLKTMTDLKVQSAKYANPLSGLPGNVPIQNKLQEYLDQNIAFNLIYVDVDHFKPYNDYYSFEQGDQVIAAVAKVLESATAGKHSFIGHIGGDDFVVITKDDYEPISQTILHEFRLVIDNFYLEEDRKKGGITSHNRDGEERFFPMMTLSLGILKVFPGTFSHTQKISSIATKAKKGAKSLGGNQCFVIDSKEYLGSVDNS